MKKLIYVLLMGLMILTSGCNKEMDEIDKNLSAENNNELSVITRSFNWDDPEPTGLGYYALLLRQWEYQTFDNGVHTRSEILDFYNYENELPSGNNGLYIIKHVSKNFMEDFTRELNWSYYSHSEINYYGIIVHEGDRIGNPTNIAAFWRVLYLDPYIMVLDMDNDSGETARLFKSTGIIYIRQY